MSTFTFQVLGLEPEAVALLPKQLQTVESLLTRQWAIAPAGQTDVSLLLVTDSALIPVGFDGATRLLISHDDSHDHGSMLELPLRPMSLMQILNSADRELRSRPPVSPAPATEPTPVTKSKPDSVEKAPITKTKTKTKTAIEPSTSKKVEKAEKAKPVPAKAPAQTKQKAPEKPVTKVPSTAKTQSKPTAKANASTQVVAVEAVKKVPAKEASKPTIPTTSAPVSKTTEPTPEPIEAPPVAAPKVEKPASTRATTSTPIPDLAALSQQGIEQVEKTNQVFWETVSKRLNQLIEQGEFYFRSKKTQIWLAFHSGNRKLYSNAKNFDSLVKALLQDPNDTWQKVDEQTAAGATFRDNIIQFSPSSLLWSLALREVAAAQKQWNRPDCRFRLTKWPRLESWESRPELFRLCSLYAVNSYSIEVGAKTSDLSPSEVCAFLHACDSVGIRIQTQTLSKEELDELNARHEAMAQQRSSTPEKSQTDSSSTNKTDNKTTDPRAPARPSLSFLQALRKKIGI